MSIQSDLVEVINRHVRAGAEPTFVVSSLLGMAIGIAEKNDNPSEALAFLDSMWVALMRRAKAS